MLCTQNERIKIENNIQFDHDKGVFDSRQLLREYCADRPTAIISPFLRMIKNNFSVPINPEDRQ